MPDAEGVHEAEPCPECGSESTVRYVYAEGFDEWECRACGWRSDAEELASLERFAGDVLQRDADVDPPPLPKKGLEA